MLDADGGFGGYAYVDGSVGSLSRLVEGGEDGSGVRAGDVSGGIGRSGSGVPFGEASYSEFS